MKTIIKTKDLKKKFCEKHPQIELVDGHFYKKLCRKCDKFYFKKCRICGVERLFCCC